MPATARPRLHSVAVELTDRCQLECAHCYNAGRGDTRSPAQQEVASTLARIRSLLDAVDLDNVTLTGGEPLSSPAFPAVAELIHERGVPWQLITNGTLLDDRLATSLCESGARSAQVALHGPDAPRHDAITGAPSFERVVRAVKLLQAKGIHVVGCTVVSRLNAAQIAATLALWRSLDVEHVALSRFSPAGMASDRAPQLLPSVPELMSVFESAAQAASKTGLRVSCTMPIPACTMDTSDYAPLRFGSCAIGTPKQEFALGTDGRLRHCALHRARLTPDLRTLRDGSWLDSALSAARGYRRRAPAFCAGCVHAPTCGGGCGAAADWLLGDARAFPDPVLWQHVDDQFAWRLADVRGADGVVGDAVTDGALR